MKNTILCLFGMLSLNVYAEDARFVVIRNEPAYNVVEVPSQLCQPTGSHGAPMCSIFYNKVKMPTEGYHVIIKEENGDNKERFFRSSEAYKLGTIVISNKD